MTIRRRARPAVNSDMLRGKSCKFDMETGDTIPDWPLYGGVRKGLLAELQTLSRQEPQFHLRLCEVRLYEELAIGAESSESILLLRAKPSVDGKPWYDDVIIKVEEESGEGNTRVFHEAGKLRTFVSIRIPHCAEVQQELVDSQEAPRDRVLIMAFLHLYCAPEKVSKRRRQKPSMVTDIFSDACMPKYNPRGFNVPFPYVEFAYHRNGNPFFSLVDTETISSPVWAHPDLDDCQKVWLFRSRPDDEEEPMEVDEAKEEDEFDSDEGVEESKSFEP